MDVASLTVSLLWGSCVRLLKPALWGGFLPIWHLHGFWALFSVLLAFTASAYPLTSLHSTGGLNINKQGVLFSFHSLSPQSGKQPASHCHLAYFPSGATGMV